MWESFLGKTTHIRCISITNLRQKSFWGSQVSFTHLVTTRAKMVCGSSSLLLRIHFMLLIQSSIPTIYSVPFCARCDTVEPQVFSF